MRRITYYKDVSHAAPQQPSSEWGKAQWRRWARLERRRFDPREAGGLITRALQEWPAFRSASRILAFVPFGGEPDIGELFSAPRKKFYATRAAPGEERRLSIHALELQRIEVHELGFPMPAPGEEVEPGSIEIALVPGLAFDRHGNRLGYGKGYFDRFLIALPEQVPLVGVSFEGLVLPRLPHEEHDIPMTHLATEAGVRGVVRD